MTAPFTGGIKLIALSMLVMPTLSFAAPTLQLPETEDRSDWNSAAQLAGFKLVKTDKADARLIGTEDGWRLLVTDEAGTIQEVDVQQPTSDEQREELVWLAKNLLTPVEFSGKTPADAEIHRTPDAVGWLGLGGIVGEPFGGSTKAYLPNPKHSFEAAAGAAWAGGWGGHAGYLYRPSQLASPGSSALYWHIGAGVAMSDRLKDGKNKKGKQRETTSAVRVPIGLDLDLRAQPIEVFVDGAIRLSVDGELGASAAFSGGIRYFFGPK